MNAANYNPRLCALLALPEQTIQLGDWGKGHPYNLHLPAPSLP